MNEYLSILETVGLFKGIDPADLASLFSCLDSTVKTAGKGDYILHAGDKPEYVGIVLSGQLHVIREDCDGNRALMTAVTQGGIFGEALCCAGVAESPVTVLAESDSIILLMRFSRILQTCPNSCVFHKTLIENMLKLIAMKNLMLQSRMEIISLKSIRAKVTQYLESFNLRQGHEVLIPFNREELANFLCVERSALSHELARMKRDGLIDYKKNKFKFLNDCAC